MIREVDEANAADPRRELVEGVPRPREAIYAERMSDGLKQLYPEASEWLRIAARAQHICRWQIPRAGYPLGREGYHAWRNACRVHHATLISKIMARQGYEATDIEHVANIVKKKGIKSDLDSQALENVVGVIFVQYYLEAFVSEHSDYDEPKLADIIGKTLRKMDGVGYEALRRLNLPPATRQLIETAS